MTELGGGGEGGERHCSLGGHDMKRIKKKKKA